MPTPKTECTELSVAFGLLGRDPFDVAVHEIGGLFVGTLSEEKFRAYLAEFIRDENHYRRLFIVGVKIRSHHPSLARMNLTTVTWEGPRQQARSVAVAKDVIAANIPISVKDDSNVVSNLSPHVLFISIPTGTSSPRRSANWYWTIAPGHYQELYAFVRSRVGGHYPEQVTNFGRAIPKDQRELFSTNIELFSVADRQQFDALYVALCHEVASRSSETFSLAITESMSGPIRDAVTDLVMKRFLRLGDSEYILCGLDGRGDFALNIPDLTSWKRDWRLRRIGTQADLTRGQSVVDFELIALHKPTRQEHSLRYHAEIRWSHGKFGTNPEAKLYKEFGWPDVPSFGIICAPSRYRITATLGEGGFGTVYKGVLSAPTRTVAIKVLSPRNLSRLGEEAEEARPRFQREVRVQSELLHPGILPILDSDLTAESPWFATPLAQGNLADILPELPNDPARIDRIFAQILDAMVYAHAQRAIHRDLKPANVLLFDNDRVAVGDFGLVKRVDMPFTSDVLTSSSRSAGSLPYAAPEQLVSLKSADQRSDIYSLGATLFAMVIGRDLIVPADINLNAISDRRYARIILSCIQHDPDDRYQTVEELMGYFHAVA